MNISIIKNGTIIAAVNASEVVHEGFEEIVIDLDTLLRELGILDDDTEIAVTEDVC